MSENKLVDLSVNFAVDIFNIGRRVKDETRMYNQADQLIRSGSSIGANIHEANYAASKPDFINKLHIALKECYETEYWLLIFEKTSLIPTDEYKKLYNQCCNLRRMLAKSIITAKSNLQNMKTNKRDGLLSSEDFEELSEEELEKLGSVGSQWIKL